MSDVRIVPDPPASGERRALADAGNEYATNPARLDTDGYVRRLLITLGIAALFMLVILAVWYLPYAFLILFASILLAVFLRGTADLVSRHSPLADNWSITVVIIVFFAALAGLIWLFGPQLVQGYDEMIQRFSRGLTQVKEFLGQFEFGKRLVHEFQTDGMALTPERLRRIFGIFSTMVGVLTTGFFIVILGVYLSVEPTAYVNSMVSVFPPEKREHARAVFVKLGHVLRWWLLGRLSSMLVVAVLTWIGLLILGVPSATMLAVLAGLLSFIPYFGPVLSAIPAVLVGWTQSLTMAVYVVFLYYLVQIIESYFITPLIQRRAVQLAPGFLLAMQVVIGVPLGIFGLLLATPLAVVVMVAVKMLYIEDVLREPVEMR